MKNKTQNIKFYNSHPSAETNSLIKNVVTTDINILLNRVKLDQKRDLKKKVIFLSLLITLVSLIAIFTRI